jgi:predicted RNA-binding protein (virulence factor B family)
VKLRVLRFAAPGAFLGVTEDPDAPAVLLPGREVPEGVREGDEVEVFVALDSEDRPIATTVAPKFLLDEVAFLKVTDVTRFGAFVDWGLPKQLLVPHAEQTRDVHVGERHPIGLYVDDSGRLAGTMRVTEMLRATGDFEEGEWVDGEAWRNDSRLGLFAILERKFVGKLPVDEPHQLKRGEAARFRIANVLPDGKVELSLRGQVSEELENDARKILAHVSVPGAARVGDRSSPERIRSLFGLSKKAFKRAVGTLLKSGAVTIDDEGFVRKAH